MVSIFVNTMVTLTCFHQILSITTIDIWENHKEKDKLASAALNLKAKRKSLETTSITASTANAIAKAHETINKNQFQNLNSALRITNLEKNIKKQEHKTNETLNLLRSANQQKNSKGSSMTGSGTSPERKTLFLNKHKKQSKRRNVSLQKIIDLSEEDPQESKTSPFQSSRLFANQTLNAKRQKNRRHQIPNEEMTDGKTVHWKDAEPTYPDSWNANPTHSSLHQPSLSNSQHGNT
jgi:hypothetical protein